MTTQGEERESGHYWVKHNGDWVVAKHYSNSHWCFPGIEQYFEDTDFEEIGEFIVRPLPDKQGESDLQAKGEAEVMIQAFHAVTKMFESRAWIKDGRGPYAYDDEEYRKEVEYLYDEFDALKRATFTNIKSRYVDFRNEVIADYLKNKTKFSIDIKQHRFGKIDRVYLEFTIGVQTFSLHDCEDLEHAQWFKVQLSHALSNLGAEISQPAIQENA